MIRSEEHHGAGVLSVEGSLTGDTAAQLRQAADRLLQRRTSDVVIDLERCPRVDSQGLESLLWLRRRCDAASGTLTLAAATPTLAEILRLTRLDHRFLSAPDVTTALKNR